MTATQNHGSNKHRFTQCMCLVHMRDQSEYIQHGFCFLSPTTKMMVNQNKSRQSFEMSSSAQSPFGGPSTGLLQVCLCSRAQYFLESPGGVVCGSFSF